MQLDIWSLSFLLNIWFAYVRFSSYLPLSDLLEINSNCSNMSGSESDLPLVDTMSLPPVLSARTRNSVMSDSVSVTSASPSVSSNCSPSFVWTYFTTEHDSHKCKHSGCTKVFKRLTSTSSLARHLRTHGVNEFSALQSTGASTPLTSPVMQRFLQSATTNGHAQRQELICTDLIDFICDNDETFALFDRPSTRRLLARIPGFDAPCSQTLSTRWLPHKVGLFVCTLRSSCSAQRPCHFRLTLGARTRRAS